MVLSEEEITHYLVSNDFIGLELLVEGDFLLRKLSGRNQNFEVITKNGSSFFLKQGIDQERNIAISREAKVYEFLKSETQKTCIFRHSIPRYYRYDSRENILILEYIHSGKNLKEHCVRIGRYPIKYSTIMGKLLGTLHYSTDIRHRLYDNNIMKFESYPTKFFSLLLEPQLGSILHLSNANLQLLQIIQHNSDFVDFLKYLFSNYRRECLVHSDIKLENFMVVPNDSVSYNPLKSGNHLKLIDWEHAHIGDPAWDVGSVFSSYLSLWLFSIPVIDENDLEEFIGLARYPIEKLQPAILSFWFSYTQQSDLRPSKPVTWLTCVVRYTAIRLIQTVFEYSQTTNNLNGHMICLLQLSFNILKYPETAIKELLGINI